MDKNELKKVIYKTQPIAILLNVRKDGLSYAASVDNKIVKFFIPYDEIGEVVWFAEMPAKLLIRYLIDVD